MTTTEDFGPVRADQIDTWDHEADVVVAGYGVAGAAAAVGAAQSGADVLVLERTGGWGGAAAMSGGIIYLGGGTPLQKACGFDDTVDAMKEFMKAALGPGVDEEKIDAYCEGSVDHYHWLVDGGVVFKEEFWGEPGWETPDDEGLMYSGGENAAPFSATIPPAPRGHVPQMKAEEKHTSSARGGGYMLMKPLTDLAARLGVRAEYDVRVQSPVCPPAPWSADRGRPTNRRRRPGGRHARCHTSQSASTSVTAAAEERVRSRTRGATRSHQPADSGSYRASMAAFHHPAGPAADQIAVMTVGSSSIHTGGLTRRRSSVRPRARARGTYSAR